MPSAREILGDDGIALLQKQGLTSVHIHDIGKRIWEQKKEEQRLQAEQDLRNKQAYENADAMGKLKLLSQETMDSDSKVAQVVKGLASNFIRTGEIANAIQLPNVFTELGKLLPESMQSITTPAPEAEQFPKKWSDLGQKLDEKKEEISQRDLSYARKVEIEKLNHELANANSAGEQAWTGIKKMADVVTHPSEWTAQGITEGVTGIENIVSLGLGGLASKVFVSPFLKVGAGALAGGAENALINAAAETARAKGQGKSEEEIKKTAIQAAAGGFVAGAPLGGMGAALTMRGENAPKVLHEDGAMPVDIADGLADNPLMQEYKAEQAKEEHDIISTEVESFNAGVSKSMNDSVVRHNAIAKEASKELGQNPSMPLSSLKTLINAKHVPTQEEMMVSTLINDGMPVENRFAGWNILHALDRSIQEPIKTPEEFAFGLKEAGFNEEVIGALTQSYVEKDLSLAYNYFNQKIQTKGADHVNQRFQTTITLKRQSDGTVPGRETNVPGENGPIGDATQGGSSDAVTHQQHQEQRLSDGGGTVPDDGRNLAGNGEDGRVPTGDENVAGQQTAGSNGDGVSGSGIDAVVQPKDGNNLGTDGTSQVKNKKSEPAVRELDENGAVTDGKPIMPGDVFKTASGAVTTPSPKQKTETYHTQWLIDNAVLEAKRRGDDFNLLQFENANAKNFTQSDRESMLMYLFGKAEDQPHVKKPFFKPLDNEALHVPKEEPTKKNTSDAKEDEADAPMRDGMDGQSGDVVTKTKENPSQNVDLRDKDPIALSKGERKKLNDSVDAILAKKPEDVSEADKEVLRQYTGNGGIENGTYGSLSEHYTPYETVRGIYDAMDRAGIPMQKVLEPAAGSGNFVGHRPDLDWTTIDIDTKAHAINKILYPNAKHYNTSFESFKGDGFDAIISNVPFIETRGAGALKNRPDVKALHDYYFVSSVDKVKEDGVVAFITTRGTMDKADMKIRKELMEKSDIIGAYRLPEGTFSKNAHTDVGADVIFLKKRAEGVKAEGKQLENNEAFVKSTKTEDGIYLSEYFQKNPENILGEMEVGVNKQFGTKGYVVKGKADYSKMKLDYAPGKSDVDSLHAKKEDLPTDSNDFWEYADNNGVETHGLDSPGILIKDGRISVEDGRVEFSDIEGGAKLFKDITDTKEGAKIELLSAIAKAAESGQGSDGKKLIETYQKEYKVHPYSDKELNRLFNAIDEKEKLAELGSFFDKNFTPAQIFDKRTRFSGSGKADVSMDSSIGERMRYHENDKGVVDVSGKPTVFAQGEFYNALEHGYSITEKGKLQNDILYYSGNLYDKAERVKSLMEVYKDDGIAYAKLEKQLSQLEEMKPQRKGIEEINIRGDEPWLLKNGLEVYPLRKVERTINKGEQKIIEYETPYGKVFDNYINGKALVSMQKDETITSYRRRLREAEEEVQNVLSRIKERILGNSRLKDGIEETYNKMFNGYVSPDYKKASYLIKDTLESLAPGLKLRDNQIEWITRAVYEGKGINAHDVGGGKTLSGVVLAKTLKDKGVAKKPLFVVPAKVIKNWEKEIKRAFPDAKIINLFNLAKETRAKKLYELGNNEADYVLISHEGFKELKLPWDVESRYVDELMSENLRTEDLKGRARALQEEKIKKYKALLSKSNNDKRITMDKLGIDAVFADEARAFKNVGVHSKLVGFKLGKPFTLDVDKNTGSITLDSAAAYDFRFKTRYISERNNGRNVYMLDATPTPNKPMEIFTMLKHLDNKIFDEYGIHSDRDFANRFFEFGATMNKKGGIEKGLVYIKNAYDLRSIMDRYVNRISMQEFKDKGIITLPEGKVEVHYLDASDESSLVFQDIRSRLLAAKSNKEERNKIMGIFSEGISASTDPRAYQRGGVRDFIDPTPENNKLEAVVSKVIERRKSDKKAGQIIFLDNAGHEQQAAREIDGQIYEPTLEKNLHQEIKEKLIASGKYKPEEIAILSGKEITDPTNGKEIKSVSGQRAADMKQAIVDAYSDGKIKVIIGTTKSAGEGMNIQKFTTDIYHMDIPWTPAEIIQRDGRGERFGNQYDAVNKHFFFQSGTFDELMYRAVTKKRGWNEALWDADVKDKIEIVDEGSAMPKEEEFMLQMEKDPIKRRELELQIEYGRLEDELKAVNEDGYVLRGRKEAIKRDIQMSEKEIVQHQERLKSDRPNQYLGELLDKIAKSKDATKKAEMQADYDYKLKNSRAHIEKMIEAKQRRIVEQNANLEKTIKAIEDNGLDVKEASRKLSLFEENHIGSDGKIKAEIAQEVC